MSENMTFLTINCKKIRVLVIGGGRAAFIKTKNFVGSGAEVYCIAKDFSDEFIKLQKYSQNLHISTEEYNKTMLSKYHIIVAATNNKDFNLIINEHCEECNKIYMDVSSPERSNSGLCAMGNTDEIAFAVRIKNKNPKASVFIKDKVQKYLSEYDEYIEFITTVRNKILDMPMKNHILSFIISEDFLYFFNKGKGREVLAMFFEKII